MGRRTVCPPFPRACDHVITSACYQADPAIESSIAANKRYAYVARDYHTYFPHATTLLDNKLDRGNTNKSSCGSTTSGRLYTRVPPASTGRKSWLLSLGFDGMPTSSMQNMFFVYIETNCDLGGQTGRGRKFLNDRLRFQSLARRSRPTAVIATFT